MENKDESTTDSASGPPEVDDFWIGEDTHAYDALKEIDRLHKEFSKVMEEIEERASDNDSTVVLKPEERTKFLEYYTVVYAHLERIAAITLYEGIGNKSERDNRNTLDFFQDAFTQATREDLLFNTGLIDAGLKGEMARVRRKRNSIAHSQPNRMHIDFSEAAVSDVGRARATVDKLENILEEQIGYCPECNGPPLILVDSAESFEEFVDEDEVNEVWFPADDWFDERDFVSLYWCSECHTIFRKSWAKVTLEENE